MSRGWTDMVLHPPLRRKEGTRVSSISRAPGARKQPQWDHGLSHGPASVTQERPRVRKCFNPACSSMCRPTNCRPGSPRSLFCSIECFDRWWRNELATLLGVKTEKAGKNSSVSHERTFRAPMRMGGRRR